jgi:type I restriction enzyme S subunit
MSILPQGWAAARLGETTSDISYGFTDKASGEPRGPKFLRITDIQEGRVDWSTVPYCSPRGDEGRRYSLQPGDIVFARTGATTGKSFLFETCPQEAVFASYLIRVRLHRGLADHFIGYFFRSAAYWEQITASLSGSAQPSCNASKLSSITIPVAPLPEQHRIAAKLDLLLARVNTCRQRLDKIPRLLARFRQSVLAAACSGKLTADWRRSKRPARTSEEPLCANMTETPCVTAISEQGGKEKTQHDNGKWFCSARDTGNACVRFGIG